MTNRLAIQTVGTSVLLAALAGCGLATPPDVARFAEPALTVIEGNGEDAPDRCYGDDIVPAVIETVTEQVLERPAETGPDGSILRPATYRTETEARILRQRQEIRFEAVCPDALTPQFVASLQRALAVRELYAGPVTGTLDSRTRDAVLRFQEPEGLHSGTLSVAAAKRLGLAVYERHEAVAAPR